MSFKHPSANNLRDHSRGNFGGATYVVREEENGAYEIDRKDRGGRIELIDSGTQEENLRKARTRAQVMAKRNSNSKKEAIVRIKPTGEVLGFGGKYEEEKRTETPEEDLKELEDLGLRAKDPVGNCIRKERREKEKGELEKKAETLEPFVDEQDNLREFSDTELSMEDIKKLTNAKEVFQQYQEDTELTVEQLEKWIDDPCRKRASGDDHDKHIKRAMFLLQEVDSPEDAVQTEVPDEIAMERAERRIPDELEGEISGNMAVFQMEYASSFISRLDVLSSL